MLHAAGTKGALATPAFLPFCFISLINQTFLFKKNLNSLSEGGLIVLNKVSARVFVSKTATRILIRYEEILKPLAKENQVRKTNVVGQKSAQQYEDNKTRTKIAKAAKVSHDTVAKFKFIERKVFIDSDSK